MRWRELDLGRFLRFLEDGCEFLDFLLGRFRETAAIVVAVGHGCGTREKDAMVGRSGAKWLEVGGSEAEARQSRKHQMAEHEWTLGGLHKRQ